MKRLTVALLMIVLVAGQAMAQSRLAADLATARDTSGPLAATGAETAASETTKRRACLRKVVVRKVDDGYGKLSAIVCATDKSLVSENHTAIAPFQTGPTRRGLASRLPQRYTGAVFRPPIA
ncbi:hypothetical protein [Oricola cellulosilytica]|uniref:Uncharacterized protein n=1 Tax=Oricola cellulosilytica TaxID=1429082 RepID=A0A4R0PB06_9HYPH|nr:hypothetical protein [Oricola cellulosilytica]TCD13410.1 hypothetical protein E0D97_13075 [Oricola cellulosilytica]